MTTNSERSSHSCRVVVGPDAVLTLRLNSPEVPIVALVDATSPIEAVLAQTAGADVVLPTTALEVGAHRDESGDTPGLALAVQAAAAIAHRRTEIAQSSRRVGHDLAGALNVIGLAAEVGRSGAIDPLEALEQIGELAKEAGDDTWRAGRAHRSSRRSLTAVEVFRLLRGPATSGHDVEVRAPDGESWVFADERQLSAAIAELVDDARGAGADRIVVDVDVDASNRIVEIIVSNDGPRFAAELVDVLGSPRCASSASERRALGLATIAEYIADIGGSFSVIDPAATDPLAHQAGVRLSIPVIDGAVGEVARRVATVDQATAQANILEGVVRHVPLSESLDAIVAAIENQLPDAACSVLLLRHRRTLHHGAGAKLPVAYREAIDGVTIGLGQGSCGTAAFTGQPVIASDVTTDQNWVEFRELATTHGLRSCWSTPIVASEGGEVLGTFAVYTTQVWTPDRAAVRLVERFTYLAAVAIEHHRLFGEEASNKAKTDFLALVSHELRTPLNAILGFAQVMQMVDLDPEQRADGVEQIVRAGEHLRDLIDELLDLSRIEAGQLSVVAEEVDSAAVIGEVLDLVRPLATSRQIELIEDPPTAAVHRLHADRRCVSQVLINLVGNAVKYTPIGGRVRVDVTTAADGMVRIGVTDSGPGLSPESIAELFQPFHRLERDGQANSEGTGLGLALSARLMDEMDGRIGVESTPGTGSCFWVEFPWSHSLPSTGQAAAVCADPAPDPGCGVLLYIEDDPACVGVLASALALRPGIELRTARTAAEGLEGLQRGDVDVVLLDIGLPDRSGWDLLGGFQSTHPDVPVVVVTAGGDVVPPGFAPPDRLVTKPIDVTEVLGAIDLALAGSTGRDKIAQSVDAFEQRGEIDGLRHESVESAVGGFAEHVG